MTMAKLTLFYKGRAIHSHALEGKRTTIGRDKDCDIVIDSLAVSPKHAIITRSGPHFHIKPTGSNKDILVNHQPSGEQLLIHGDMIQLGQYSLTFAESAVTLDFSKTTRPSTAGGRPIETNINHDKLDELVGSLNVLPKSCLQIISGEHLGKTIPLHRSLLRLGLSGNQCAIIAHRSDGYYLSHLEGDCPPLVNGKAINDKSVLLSNGSVIQIGDIQMRFHEEIAKAAAI
jgi:predicted component of type VI protein secretion system